MWWILTSSMAAHRKDLLIPPYIHEIIGAGFVGHDAQARSKTDLILKTNIVSSSYDVILEPFAASVPFMRPSHISRFLVISLESQRNVHSADDRHLFFPESFLVKEI
jgi:hypothetical protein